MLGVRQSGAYTYVCTTGATAHFMACCRRGGWRSLTHPAYASYPWSPAPVAYGSGVGIGTMDPTRIKMLATADLGVSQGSAGGASASSRC